MTFRVTSPVSIACIRIRFRTSKPAAISSVRHTAICATTNALRKRDWLSCAPKVEPSSFKAALKLGRERCNPGDERRQQRKPEDAIVWLQIQHKLFHQGAWDRQSRQHDGIEYMQRPYRQQQAGRASQS